MILMSFAVIIEKSSYNARGTYVGGLISTETTWDILGNPYIVIDNVTIESGIELTIEGGVEIRFNGSFSLFVNGSLQAIGSSASRINFTSNNPTPNPGDWNGILINASGNVTMTFADARRNNCLGGRDPTM